MSPNTRTAGKVGDTGGRWALVDAAAGGLTRRLFFATTAPTGMRSFGSEGEHNRGTAHRASGRGVRGSG